MSPQEQLDAIGHALGICYCHDHGCGGAGPLHAMLEQIGELKRRCTDEEVQKILEERDNAEEWADKLANAIAAHVSEDIGEHSNLNNPWANALALID